MRIDIEQFSGMVPRASERDQPPPSARKVQNAKLWSGDMRPFRNPLDVYAPAKPGAIRSIYPLGGFWLHWTQEVYAAPGVVAGDTSGRTYFSGEGNPRVTNTALATGSGTQFPTSSYRLGLPAPDTAPTVGATGGSTGNETRSYLYTFVTAFGEEGPPSAAETHSDYTDATQWDLSGMDAAPPNSWDVYPVAISAGNVTLTLDASHFIETGEEISVTETVQEAPEGATFDGATLISSDEGAVSDGATGILAFAMRVPSGALAGGPMRLLTITQNVPSTPSFTVDIDTAGKLSIVGRDSGGTQRLDLATGNGAITEGTYHEILASWNTGSGTPQLYIDDVDAASTATVSAGSIAYSDPNVGIGGAFDLMSGLHDMLNASLRGLYFNIDTDIDLSSSSNRRKFFLANRLWASLGADGSTPTGGQPMLYLPNGHATFTQNAGSDVDMQVETGALTSEYENTIASQSLAVSGQAVTRASATTVKYATTVTVARTFVTRTAARDAPLQTGGMLRFIYRTDADGTFRFVASQAVGTSTYTDTTANADLSATELPSTTWSAPPGDLTGLIALPNKIYAGISGNQVCFSEPGQPHAWPEEYRKTIPATPVALGYWGGNVVVATNGKPQLITGTHPANMSVTELDYAQACVSARSLVSMATGVVYASPNGLVFVGAGGVRVITKGLFRRDEWQVYSPATMRAEVYDDRYVVFYSGAGVNADGSGALVIDPEEPLAHLIELTLSATAVHRDLETDTLYVVNDGVLRQVDTGGAEEQMYWRSKRFVVPRPCNLGAFRLRMTSTADITDSDRSEALAASAPTITALYRHPNGLITDTLKQGGGFGGYSPGKWAVASGPYDAATAQIPDFGTSVTFKLFAREASGALALKFTKVVESDSTFLLPGGYKSDEYEIELSSNGTKVHGIALAETPGELARSTA